MKKIYILSILFLLTMRLAAQSYTPLPMIGANWNNIFWGFTSSYYHETVCGEDTIIGPHTYKKLYHYFYNPSNGNILSSYYECGVRNDTLNKQVWYVNAGNTTEEILFDFNLMPGDSITLTINDFTPYSLTYHVQSVGTTVINSTTCKTITFDTVGNGFVEKWTESIGSTEGLYHRGHPMTSNYYVFDCLSVAGNFIYATLPTQTTCASYVCTTGLPEPEQFSFSFYPNPAQNQLHLDGLDPARNYEQLIIRDATGRIVLQKNPATGISALDLDLSTLSSGLYLLELHSGTARAAQELIIR